ncbi:MAG: hypothetical protein MZV63_65270 [Marinilabiliales bacterium]|nr:hypothetical protein [Marinilabiliales bacterium]
MRAHMILPEGRPGRTARVVLFDLLGREGVPFVVELQANDRSRRILEERQLAAAGAEELRRAPGLVEDLGLAGRLDPQFTLRDRNGHEDARLDLVCTGEGLEGLDVERDGRPRDRRLEPGHGPLRLQGEKAEVVDAERGVTEDHDARSLRGVEPGERPVAARAAVVPDDLGPVPAPDVPTEADGQIGRAGRALLLPHQVEGRPQGRLAQAHGRRQELEHVPGGRAQGPGRREHVEVPVLDRAQVGAAARGQP